MNDILSRTIITGADGALGSYADFGIKTDLPAFDISDMAKVREFLKEKKPAAVLHLAAVTDMGKCESDPGFAYRVNAAGTYHLALVCREVGARLIYVSTAGVFDGAKKGAYSEEDIPNPPNVYGHSKYLGELAVRNILPEKDFLIVRSCMIFGGGPEKDKKFIGKIMTQLKDPKTTELKGVNDEIGSPTYGKDLMAALKKFIDERKSGIVHVANAGAASRFDVLKLLAENVAPNMKLTSVPLSYFNPKTAVTMNQELSSRGGLLRPWQEALTEYITEEWSS